MLTVGVGYLGFQERRAQTNCHVRKEEVFVEHDVRILVFESLQLGQLELSVFDRNVHGEELQGVQADALYELLAVGFQVPKHHAFARATGAVQEGVPGFIDIVEIVEDVDEKRSDIVGGDVFRGLDGKRVPHVSGVHRSLDPL
jgi:hypothetical protein